MSIFSAFVGDNEDLSDNIDDITSNFVDAGESILEITGSKSLPLEVDEQESKHKIRAEIPFLSSNFMDVNSDSDSISLSIEKPDEAEGRDMDIEGIKNTFEDLLDIPEDVDFSTLSAHMSEGVFELEVEKEDFDESEDHQAEDEF